MLDSASPFARVDAGLSLAEQMFLLLSPTTRFADGRHPSEGEEVVRQGERQEGLHLEEEIGGDVAEQSRLEDLSIKIDCFRDTLVGAGWRAPSMMISYCTYPQIRCYPFPADCIPTYGPAAPAQPAPAPDSAHYSCPAPAPAPCPLLTVCPSFSWSRCPPPSRCWSLTGSPTRLSSRYRPGTCTSVLYHTL